MSTLSPAAQAIQDGRTLRQVVGSGLEVEAEKIIGLRVAEIGDVVQIPRAAYMRMVATLEEAVEALKVAARGFDSAYQGGKNHSLVFIIQSIVAAHCGFNVAQLKGRLRTEQLVNARHIAMYLTRERTTLSLKEIGREFDKAHGTVIYACQRMEKILSMNDTTPQNMRLREDYAKIITALLATGRQL